MKQTKERVFTFKTDDKLGELLARMPNRSEFIRRALQTAMEHNCPLCHGSGILSQEQQTHLAQFLQTHPLERCSACNAVHFHCLEQSPSHSDLHQQ